MDQPRTTLHGGALRAKIQLLRPDMEAAAAGLWQHPELTRIYPELLILLHTIIRSSVPLLQLAADECSLRSETIPGAPEMAAYFREHASEEQNHDEWLIEDLACLNISRQQVLCRAVSPNIASLVGAQYYWARHSDPVCVLGYLAVLEGKPASLDFLESIMRSTGLPQAAFRTYVVHARLDPQHAKELFALIDGLPLTPSQISLLGVSAFHSIACITLAFRELLAQFQDPGRFSLAEQPAPSVGSTFTATAAGSEP